METRVRFILACGHSSYVLEHEKPYCAIDFPEPESVTIMETPNLSGRKAKCSFASSPNHKPPVDSEIDLPFFEYKGPDSFRGRITCKNCGFYEQAHGGDKRRYYPENRICDNFESVGAFEFDEYYCGCRGWD